MKICLTALAFLFFLSAKSQEETFRQADSLKNALAKIKQDTSRILMLTKLAEAYRSAKPDTAIIIAEDALTQARNIKFIKGEIRALLVISVLHREKGDIPYALEIALKGLRMADEHSMKEEMLWGRIRVANVYIAVGNFAKGISYLEENVELLKTYPSDYNNDVTHLLMSSAFIQQDQLDSALNEMKLITGKKRNNDQFYIYVFNGLGNIEEKKNNFAGALDNYRKSISIALFEVDYRTASVVYNSMAGIFKKLNQVDSAIYYAKEGLKYGEMLGYKNRILTASKLLAQLYENRDPKEAVKYYKMASAANDSLYGAKKVLQLQATTVKEQERQRESEDANIAYKNKMRQYMLMGAIAVFLIIAVILFRNNRQKQKAYTKLVQQQEELKATQQQLIQSEKMASLGELTAGIAHEIQNPLNFVNNFSEVSTELADELRDAVEKNDNKQAIAIADDIKQNLNKINHHGKRADAIVKGMLQHSRSSSGKKEPTDINALADEYLRLSYHGLRAKDKTFNATMETHYDDSLEKINVIPQDIGRVILNLITNAFYAVDEKKKLQDLEGFKNLQGLNTFTPTVSVSTKRVGDKVLISVKDNGPGIPQKVLDKIFQPFFTTKPTGQGTGLGLSLSYDIVKAHGGELKVETKEAGPDDPVGRGEGSEFIILLPAKSGIAEA
ncbi:MAG: ATP-binding protein [Bacteroidota bacterium]|nr:ATP-binding protein [Bacteroidota bacterium]